MAYKLVKEILLAEEQAENIIADASREALEISKSSEAKAQEETVSIIDDANANAKSILENAKSSASKKALEAEAEAKAENASLQALFEQNLPKAINSAINILTN